MPRIFRRFTVRPPGEITRSRAVAGALVAALAPWSAACADTGTPDPAASAADTARASVLAEVRRYYDDFSARDWEAFASHFWPDATITTTWQPPGESEVRVVVSTVPDFVAQAEEGPGSRAIFEERMSDSEVLVTGNLAVVWADYTARFGDPGDVMEWTGTDAFTLMRRDGQWKITSLAYAGAE